MTRSLADLPVFDMTRLPWLNREQMAEVDRLAIEEFGLGLLQMMESAGLFLAETVRLYLGGSVAAKSILIVCGSGNNGGGGLSAARRLAIWGADLRVLLLGGREQLTEAAAAQLAILERSQVSVVQFEDGLPPHDLLLDAMVGYSLRGPLRGAALNVVEAWQQVRTPIIALDLPSGVDADSGDSGGAAIQASITVMLALSKLGLLREAGRRQAGELLLADIGIPNQVYEHLGLQVPKAVFSSGPLVRLQ